MHGSLLRSLAGGAFMALVAIVPSQMTFAHGHGGGGGFGHGGGFGGFSHRGGFSHPMMSRGSGFRSPVMSSHRGSMRSSLHRGRPLSHTAFRHSRGLHRHALSTHSRHGTRLTRAGRNGSLPAGFSHGNASWKQNGGTPAGWSQGKKTGWGCTPGSNGCMPPGLSKKGGNGLSGPQPAARGLRASAQPRPRPVTQANTQSGPRPIAHAARPATHVKPQPISHVRTQPTPNASARQPAMRSGRQPPAANAQRPATNALRKPAQPEPATNSPLQD